MSQRQLSPGFLLVSRDAQKEPGAWFIFHHGPEGTAAFDLTTEHPHIGYKGFESVLNFEDTRPETEKVVLLGEPREERDGAEPDQLNLTNPAKCLIYDP